MLAAKQRRLIFSATLLLVVTCAMFAQLSLAQRGNGNSGDDDDFDDAGFDDSGYNQPQRETESSNHNPNNYSPSDGEDLDDDDEVDESQSSPQVAEDTVEQPTNQEESSNEQQQQQANEQLRRRQQQQQQQQVPQMPFLDNVQTQNFYAPPNAMYVANVHPSAAAVAAGYVPFGYQGAHLRYRRTTDDQRQSGKPEGDIEDDLQQKQSEGQRQLSRRKRHAKGHSYIGPVYTFVKTDKHANFKWGVKHKVGKHYG